MSYSLKQTFYTEIITTAVIIAAVAVMSPFTVFADEGELLLADRGATDYTIVLSDTASAVQQTAARELASFLNQVTGAEFPILSEGQVDERAKNKEKLLVIGQDELSKKLLASAGAEPEETIGQDGIILQTVGSSIVFSGHPDRGILYAVYTFLEDYVGCRWWTSTESFVPSTPQLEVPPLSIRYVPPIISREAYYQEPHNGHEGVLFSARMKMNGEMNLVPEEYGSHMTILFWVHSFDRILPPEKYFADHPDWYALVDGKRTGQEVHQLCLTNPEMKAEFIRNTLAALREKPGTRFVSVSQNDCAGWCQCPECRALVEKNGSQSGPLITFVNDVAEAVEREFPDVLVETLAYQDTRFAPTDVAPRDNVVVRLCSIEYSFLTPIADGGPFNESLRESVEKWSAISKNLYVWDYVTNFSNYLLPHPNLQVLGANIRFLADNHTIGIFEQGDAECSAGDFVRLRNWVISELLWNPSRDQRELENDFLNGYYSPRVGAIFREYLDVLTESALSSRISLRCYMMSSTEWLDTAALLKATDLMNRAIDTAKQDEAAEPVRYAGLVKKVERESLPIRYVWLLDGRFHQSALERMGVSSPLAEDAGAYYEKFKELLAENQVTTTKEWAGKFFDEWLDSLQPCNIPANSVPAAVEALPPHSWVDTHEADWALFSIGRWTFSEEEPAAYNHRTVRILNTHAQRIIRMDTDLVQLLDSPSGSTPDQEGHVRGRILLSLRCQANEGADGDAIDIGIDDLKSRQTIYARTLTVDELAGPDYRIIDLGEMELGKNLQFWIAPKNRPEAVPNIFLDRMVFIRK